MKTFINQLERLAEPHRSKAIANLKAHEIKEGFLAERSAEIYDYLSEILMAAFYWSHTPEGFQYWDNIYKRLESQEYIERELYFIK